MKGRVAWGVGQRKAIRDQSVIWRVLLLCIFFVPCHLPLAPLIAAQLPSLFRGVAVADSPSGVRVISVDDGSQASLLDLRPEDVIVSINGAAIRSIDEFAVSSQTLKGQAQSAAVVLLRNGQPYELVLHVYSLPILKQWQIRFVPDDEMRFAEPKAGVEYWSRLGRGFEIAGDPEQALQAYLNALHNDAKQTALAAKAAELSWQVAQRRLQSKQLPQALTAIDQGTTLLARLFDQPMDGAQLQIIKRNLEDTLRVLQQYHEKSS